MTLRARWFRASALLAVVLPATLQAQSPPATAPEPRSEVRFDFARTGLPVPKFTLAVKEDGTGSYIAVDNSSSTPQQVSREFNLTAATTGKIFALARYIHPKACGTHLKNIADSGAKTLTYVTSTGTSSCDYNYSESKEIESLTEIFQGLAETLDQGRRLDFLHRFDRLGLDDAIASLSAEVSAGRAIEIGAIEPTLRSIAGDADVMQRVRAKATALLATVPAYNTSR